MIEFNLDSKLENDTIVVNVVLSEEEQQQYEYAYYLVKDGERILTKWYSKNNRERLVLKEQGAYYVTCFVRNIRKKSDMVSKNTQLFLYLQDRDSQYVMGSRQSLSELSLSESQFDIRSQLIDHSILKCEIYPSDNNFEGLEFAFYLMNEFQKKESTPYTPYNQVRFSLSTPGIYSVRCFVRRNQELIIKTSRFHGFKMEEPISRVGETINGGGNYNISHSEHHIQISA